MTKGENCKLGTSPPMSNSAWCDLNRKGDLLKLHDKCPNVECNSREQITFAPRHFQLEGAGSRSEFWKVFRGTQTA